MNGIVDDMINKIDAVICGAEPGAVPLPEFDEPTLAQLRDIVRPVVLDCRVCERYATLAKVCTIPSHCVMGDKFKRIEFVPLWRVAP